MAANFMLAAKMGLAQKIDRDRETKASFNERLLDLNNKKREWLFQSYMSGSADRKKSVAAKAAMIKQAMTDGFSKQSAMLLEASGELGDHLSRISDLKGKGEFNRERVKAMDRLVMESLDGRSDEEKTAALDYLRQGSLNYQNESEFQDEFINAIFSANPKSLQKATELYSNVMSSSGGGLDFGPTGLSTRVLGDYSSTMRAQIDKAIARNVEGYLGDAKLVFREDGSTSWTGTDSGAAQKIVKTMADVVEASYYNPEETGDWKSVIGVMADNIGLQSEVQGLKIKDYKVSTSLDFVPPSATPPGPNPIPSAADPASNNNVDPLDDDDNLLNNQG